MEKIKTLKEDLKQEAEKAENKEPEAGPKPLKDRAFESCEKAMPGVSFSENLMEIIKTRLGLKKEEKINEQKANRKEPEVPKPQPPAESDCRDQSKSCEKPMPGLMEIIKTRLGLKKEEKTNDQDAEKVNRGEPEAPKRSPGESDCQNQPKSCEKPMPGVSFCENLMEIIKIRLGLKKHETANNQQEEKHPEGEGPKSPEVPDDIDDAWLFSWLWS